MKKFLLPLLLLAFSASLYAANSHVSSVVITGGTTGKRATSVPQPVLDSYNAMYPGATTLRWSRKSETRYQVVFIYNGVKMTASYAPDGTYLGQ